MRATAVTVRATTTANAGGVGGAGCGGRERGGGVGAARRGYEVSLCPRGQKKKRKKPNISCFRPNDDDKDKKKISDDTRKTNKKTQQNRKGQLCRPGHERQAEVLLRAA